MWKFYSLITAAHGAMLEVVNSYNSGPVVVASLGGQSLLMGLDFMSATSSVYNLSECPPFMRGFNIDLSTTAVRRSGPVESTGFSLENWRYVPVTDSLRVDGGALSDPKFRFKLIERSETSEFVFREVAGTIGADMEAPLFANKVMVLREDNEEQKIGIYDHGVDQSAVFVDSKDEGLWTIEVDMRSMFDSNELSIFKGKVILLPGTDDLTLPETDAIRLMTALGEIGIRSGRSDTKTLLIECGTALPPITLTVGSLVITIPASELLVTPGESRGRPFRHRDGQIRRMCATRIQVGGDEYAFIGRLLMRSVERMYFDYGRKMIGIVPLEANHIPSGFISTSPFTLLYSYPTISENEDKPIVFRGGRGRSGLALVSFFPRPVPGFPGVKCWDFVAVNDRLSIVHASKLNRVIPGDTFHMHMGTAGEEISFETRPAAPGSPRMELFIRSSPGRINVCSRNLEGGTEPVEMGAPSSEQTNGPVV